jgi:hypothetical protein
VEIQAALRSDQLADHELISSAMGASVTASVAVDLAVHGVHRLHRAETGDHDPAVLGNASNLLVAQHDHQPYRPAPRSWRAQLPAARPGRPVDACRSVASVESSRELRPAVLSGEITVSFRQWRRPQVKVGVP